MATKNQVLDALRIRYDYYASGSVLNELMELNRITGEDGFSERDIKKLADSLARSGSRAEKAVGALNELAEAEKAKAATAKKAPAKKAPAKKAAAKKAPAKGSKAKK